MRPGSVRVALVALALCGSGCRALVELVEADGVDSHQVDGGLDDEADAGVDCSWPDSPGHVDPCAIPPAGEPLILGPGLWTYDTNSGALTDPQLDASFPASALVTETGGHELRVLSAAAIDVQEGAVLRATGKRPLVLVSWSDLTVTGTIDVGSRVTGAGAGANPPACPDVAAQNGASSSEGAGGGGGGGFAGAGGAGGAGNGGATAAGAGGAAVPLPEVIRGGCPGGRGGNTLATPAGDGGGAMYLLARDTIRISGVLDAGGAGGGGSIGDRSGGSGAGSGGMIALEASVVTLATTAILASNGGGGGGGSDGGIALDGQDALAEAVAAGGGDGQGMGAAGGDGAAAQLDAEPGTMANRGGGGGGGGTGFIAARAPTFEDDGAVISPPLTTR